MNDDPCRFLLPEAAAQSVTLICAVEREDRKGLLIGADDRRRASQAARAVEDDGWPVRRAEALSRRLAEQWPFLPRLLRWTRVGRGSLVPAALAGFLIGLTTNALGPERRIHVLALPLAGILAWNVAVLTALAVRRVAFRRLSAGHQPRPLPLEWLEGWYRRLVHRWPLASADAPELVRRCLTAYLREWLPVVGPLAGARLRRALHTAALTLLLGAVGGMYLRGIVFAYQASWESTFLDTEAVEWIAAVVLAPASVLSGIEIPSLEVSRRLAGDVAGAGTDAAPWIHLWALTAILVAGAPRLALAALASLGMARLSRRLEVVLPEPYLRRLLAAVSSDGLRIEVLPYSYQLSTAVKDELKGHLLDVYGVRAAIRIRPPVPYGSAPADVAGDSVGARLVIFNLAQTPEPEVHGEFLASLAGGASGTSPPLAIIDAAAFRDRLPAGAAGDERIEKRRRTWNRVLEAAGVEPIHLDLRRDSAAALADALAAGEVASVE